MQEIPVGEKLSFNKKERPDGKTCLFLRFDPINLSSYLQSPKPLFTHLLDLTNYPKFIIDSNLNLSLHGKFHHKNYIFKTYFYMNCYIR